MADIRIVAQNPSSVYVLSSRFHRFFLKNLEPSEINTRIMRIDDTDATHLRRVQSSTPSVKYSVVRNMPGNGSIQRKEHVNVIRRPVESSFLSFINNQRPATMAYKRVKIPGYRFARNEDYYNVKLGDFNGLRIAKNVSYNVSTFH